MRDEGLLGYIERKERYPEVGPPKAYKTAYQISFIRLHSVSR